MKPRDVLAMIGQIRGPAERLAQFTPEAWECDLIKRAVSELERRAHEEMENMDRRVELAPGYMFDKRELRGISRHDVKDDEVHVFFRNGGRWTVKGVTYEDACRLLGWATGRKAA